MKIIWFFFIFYYELFFYGDICKGKSFLKETASIWDKSILFVDFMLYVGCRFMCWLILFINFEVILVIFMNVLKILFKESIFVLYLCIRAYIYDLCIEKEFTVVVEKEITVDENLLILNWIHCLMFWSVVLMASWSTF